MAGFEEQLSFRPNDFFAQLYEAEALRRRFPLSERVPRAFERAAATLATADVGEARASLASYLREELAAVASHRAQFLPLLERREAEAQRGTLSALGSTDLLVLLGQTGPAGVDRALGLLDGEPGHRLGQSLSVFYRAELIRGRDDRASVAALYRSARDALCSRGASNSQNECQRARWRLQQMEAPGG